MIKLSENYLYNLNINNDFSIFITNELLTSVLLNKMVDSSEFILGIKGTYPDLFCIETGKGYEITQSDLNEDLNYKRICKALSDSNFDFEKAKEIIESKYNDVDLRKYIFKINKDGKVDSIQSNSGPMQFLYFLPIFEKNVRSKLSKLNSGYYSSSVDVSLVVTLFSREKTVTDFNEMIKRYQIISQEYNKQFSALYLLSVSNIYIYKDGAIERKEILPNIYSDSLQKVKDIINSKR